MSSVSVRVTFSIRFSSPVPLSRLNEHKGFLKERGVYLLTRGLPKRPLHTAPNVFYIGKAISETIFSRAQKHANAIIRAKHKTGTSKTRPGRRFRAFCEKIGYRLTDLWLIPGKMNDRRSFEVSCAEEWLLWNYKRKNRLLPQANTHVANDL